MRKQGGKHGSNKQTSKLGLQGKMRVGLLTDRHMRINKFIRDISAQIWDGKIGLAVVP